MTLVPQHSKIEGAPAALALALPDKPRDLKGLWLHASTSGGSGRYHSGATRHASDASLPAAPVAAGQGA